MPKKINPEKEARKAAKNRHITFEEFKEHLTNMDVDGVTLRQDGEFSFGFNWLDYVKTRMDENIIGMHMANLKDIYDQIDYDLTGKTLLDIGCGSGLSSISFARLGCNKITSIDIDEYSVEASQYTKANFSNDADWNIFRASILDGLERETQGLPWPIVEKESQDIVYSWGVLHHTGDMWAAIRNAVDMIKPGGLFHVALYRSGNKFPSSLEEKYQFKYASMEEKMQLLYERAGQKLFHVKKGRGMNKFHDALDWLGGLPYDVADPEVLFSWLKDKYGMKVLYFVDSNGGGNFTAILQKV